jgi:tetratricopeptide (TPR) repeat protein
VNFCSSILNCSYDGLHHGTDDASTGSPDRAVERTNEKGFRYDGRHTNPTSITTHMEQTRPNSIVKREAPAALFPILVLVVTALPFLPTMGYGFVYDDNAAIVNNGYIQSWRGVAAYLLPSAMRSNSVGVSSNAYNTYRPFFYFWLRLNDALFGLNPVGWHVMSLCIHLLATLAVFFLLKRHFRNPWIATAGASIFGVHPVHIETVVWVSSATDSFMTLGIVASLLLWMQNVKSPDTRLKLGSLACYAGALLFKETGVIFPAIVFLYLLLESSPTGDAEEGLGSRFRQAMWGTLPFVGVTIVYLLMRTLSLHAMPTQKPWISGIDVLITQPWLLLFYLRHLIWPAKLSVFYDLVPVSGLRDIRFWLPLLALAALALCAVLWWRWRREQAIPAACAWLLIPLAPVLDIALFQKDDFAHDRYLYLPCLGFAIMCCLLMKNLAESSTQRYMRYFSVVLAPLLIMALGSSTMTQAHPWRDDLSLYTYALLRSKNFGARNNLASEYARRGRFEEANVVLQPLVKELPDSWMVNYNFGYVNYRLKHLDLAEEYLRRAIAIDPRNGDEFTYLGLTYSREGRADEAAAELSQAIERDPGAAGNHLGLGMIRMQQHDMNAAKAEFVEELKRHPGSGPALQQLAVMNLSGSSQSVKPVLPAITH